MNLYEVNSIIESFENSNKAGENNDIIAFYKAKKVILVNRIKSKLLTVFNN